MSADHKHSREEGDLDSTDKLPVLEGVEIAEDVHDDAVRMDSTAVLPGPAPAALAEVPRTDFARPAAVDLPSLAESVRSVEERIARQSAEYEALSRLYEKSRDAESAAVARATALSTELGGAQSALAVERASDARAGALARGSQPGRGCGRARGSRKRCGMSERHQSEARTLRESLAARDATIVQVLHSLGERDAQLSALQREHAQDRPGARGALAGGAADAGGPARGARARGGECARAQDRAADFGRARAQAQAGRGGDPGGASRGERGSQASPRRISRSCRRASGAAALIRTCFSSGTRGPRLRARDSV